VRLVSPRQTRHGDGKIRQVPDAILPCGGRPGKRSIHRIGTGAPIRLGNSNRPHKSLAVRMTSRGAMRSGTALR
jgi:hypothetical protein